MFRQWFCSLPFIVITALLIRLVFLVNYVQGKPDQALGALSFLYEPGNIAFALATHHGFSDPFRTPTGPTAWMTPVYPVVLAAIFRIFGAYTFHAFLAAALFNIACSAAACVPIYLAGRLVHSRALGATAAWFWAIFPNAVIMATRDMWDGTLAALLSALVLLATLQTADSRDRRQWLTYGLVWGIALMTTPTLGSVLPIMFAWLIWRGRAHFNVTAAHAALALALIVAVCLPWTVRNYLVFHTLVPLRSVMGLQLWMGSNEQSGRVWPGSLHPLSNAAERERYMELGETAYMRLKRDEAVAFIAVNPGRVASLSIHRFIATWTGGTETPLGDFIRQRGFYFRSILIANLLAGAGALFGFLLLVLKKHPYAIPLAAFPLLFPLISYITLASPRYRLPTDPEVLLLAALPLAYLWRRKAAIP